MLCYIVYTLTLTRIYTLQHIVRCDTQEQCVYVLMQHRTPHIDRHLILIHTAYSTRCVLVQYTLVARCNFLSFHSFFLFFHSFFLILFLFISAVLIHNLLFPKHIAIFLRDSHMQFPSSYIHFSKLKIKKPTKYR